MNEVLLLGDVADSWEPFMIITPFFCVMFCLGEPNKITDLASRKDTANLQLIVQSIYSVLIRD